MATSNSLKSKTVGSLFWSFLERTGQQGIQFVISIVLARILLPEQFGLIAMIMIFMAIAQVFVDSGFGQALIQKKNITHVDECSIFYFNILISFLVAVGLNLAAPWIAAFYEQPLLTPITRVLSLNLIINAFGLIQTTLLIKQVNFKTQLKVSMIAIVLSGTVGITMAYMEFGVWSLVTQSLCASFFRTILLWMFQEWRPSFIFSAGALRQMAGFGSKILFSELLEAIFRNIYLIAIGKLFTVVELGYYSYAQKLQQLPSWNLSNSVDRIIFPIFSSIQTDKASLKRGMQKAIMFLAMINFPLMFGLAVVANPLVFVLLTEKWLPMVPYLQLLCAVGILYPLHVINLNVLKAQGHSDLFLRLQILKKILQVIAIFITYRWGILAMIYGQIVTTCISYYLNSYYTDKMINYPATEQLRDSAPYFILSGIMGVVLYAFNLMPIHNQLVLLTIQIVSGIVFYLSFCRILKLQSFMEALELAGQKLPILRQKQEK